MGKSRDHPDRENNQQQVVAICLHSVTHDSFFYENVTACLFQVPGFDADSCKWNILDMHRQGGTLRVLSIKLSEFKLFTQNKERVRLAV